MIIRIALIRREHISEAHELANMLQKVMEAGQMRDVDQTTRKLLALTNKKHSISISEESWHKLISSVRHINADFKSDYLIEKKQIQIILSANLGALYNDVVDVMKEALELESVVLQLPLEEED
jgi:hypothetical protein